MGEVFYNLSPGNVDAKNDIDLQTLVEVTLELFLP